MATDHPFALSYELGGFDYGFEAKRFHSPLSNNYSLPSDIGFGAAVLFGATATVLYFVTDWDKSGTSGHGHEPRAQRSLSVALAAPGGFGASLRGKF